MLSESGVLLDYLLHARPSDRLHCPGNRLIAQAAVAKAGANFVIEQTKNEMMAAVAIRKQEIENTSKNLTYSKRGYLYEEKINSDKIYYIISRQNIFFYCKRFIISIIFKSSTVYVSDSYYKLYKTD